MTQTEYQIPTNLHSVDQVKRVNKMIKDLAEGGEIYMATDLERKLHTAVLESVAGGNAQAGWIAGEALNSSKIPFKRIGQIR